MVVSHALVDLLTQGIFITPTNIWGLHELQETLHPGDHCMHCHSRRSGVPGPTRLTVSYDALGQTVILAWSGADTSMITGYNVCRAIKGQNFSLITQTPLPDTATTYRDSAIAVATRSSQRNRFIFAAR